MPYLICVRFLALLVFTLLPGLAIAQVSEMFPLSPVAPVVLRNHMMEATIRGGVLSGLRVAPDGSGKMRQTQFVRRLHPHLWEPTPQTRVTKNGTTVATIAPLRVYQERPLRIEGGGAGSRADKLLPGQTLAQTFRISERTVFAAVAARIPTWQTTTSGATLRLYRGKILLATRRVTNAVDNAWQEIKPLTPQGAGEYRLTLSEPVGEIGWWGRSDDAYANGEAWKDGTVILGDRTLRVDARSQVGQGTLHVSLTGNAFVVNASFRPEQAVPPSPPQSEVVWQWHTSWTKAGYDVSPKAGTVFSRFFSDNHRYMPAEQLKRREQGGLSFAGCSWIEMEGGETADLRLSSPDGLLRLGWAMTNNEMRLRLGTRQQAASDKAGAVLRSRLRVVIEPRLDSVPPTFPRFAFADKSLTHDANRFWWGTAFTYPSPALPAAWFEWMAQMRCWYDGPARSGEMQQLETYPITPEGYVHTWGQDVGWPLRPAPTTDTRHFDTNARFILACWRFWRWTGDDAFLKRQESRLRSAMRYQLVNLKGSDGLIVTQSRDVQGRHGDQSNNYWDILPFGHLDAYANSVFYASLEAMQEMEAVLGGPHEWDYTVLRGKTYERYNAVFWDEQKGRYIGCVDANGARHDYGFTFVNIEALYYGLGNAEKARRIYQWMETEPTSSGKADTYTRFVFAPRATTIHNPRWGADAPTPTDEKNTLPAWWVSWWKGTPYGKQCQDGGAILYLSYYDLMVRSRYFGAENAWKRWQEILTRYRLPDRLSGGSPLFTGETPQQENPGQVGTDYPFPESGLVPCYLFYGVIGVEATPKGLQVTPRLPKSVPFAEVRGIAWRGARLAVRATRTHVRFTGTTVDGKPFYREQPLNREGHVLLVLPVR